VLYWMAGRPGRLIARQNPVPHKRTNPCSTHVRDPSPDPEYAAPTDSHPGDEDDDHLPYVCVTLLHRLPQTRLMCIRVPQCFRTRFPLPALFSLRDTEISCACRIGNMKLRSGQQRPSAPDTSTRTDKVCSSFGITSQTPTTQPPQTQIPCPVACMRTLAIRRFRTFMPSSLVTLLPLSIRSPLHRRAQLHPSRHATPFTFLHRPKSLDRDSIVVSAPGHNGGSTRRL
jgi:hypothetical protein